MTVLSGFMCVSIGSPKSLWLLLGGISFPSLDQNIQANFFDLGRDLRKTP